MSNLSRDFETTPPILLKFQEYKNPWLDIFGHEIGPRMATTVNLIFAPWNSKEKNILLANDPVLAYNC